MDTIKITKLPAQTFLGSSPHEKAIMANLLIDISFDIDIQQAANSDNLSDTMDYNIIADYLTTWLPTEKTNLLESLAHKVANRLTEKFKLDNLLLTITKGRAINNTTDVSISLTR